MTLTQLISKGIRIQAEFRDAIMRSARTVEQTSAIGWARLIL
jgi:hypothetical protein